MRRPRILPPNRHTPPAREGVLDAPTKEDHLRLRRARRQARARVAKIEGARDLEMLAALRAEMSAVVRSAAPVLISLLALEGLTLDEAVELIRPSPHWPLRSKLSEREVHAHLGCHYPAGVVPTELMSWPADDYLLQQSRGRWLQMQVVEHSLDLYAGIEGVVLETRFGELRVELDDKLPDALLIASVGQTIDEVVDHEMWRGRGWRIMATENAYPSLSGQTLIVKMGSVPYRMPWSS